MEQAFGWNEDTLFWIDHKSESVEEGYGLECVGSGYLPGRSSQYDVVHVEPKMEALCPKVIESRLENAAPNPRSEA